MGSAARLVLLLAVAAVVSLTAVGTAGAVTAHASGKCKLGKDGRKLGATYVTSLSVKRVSCSSGKRVVKAFNTCRRHHGGVKGRCNSKVRGFRCKERRQSIPTEISSHVSCKAGRRSVVFNYSQFT